MISNYWKYLLLIISIFISAVIETDIYLPAFADMMAFFNQTEGSIQSILSVNFIGLCLSGPIYGPLSDSFGRKPPLMVALSLFFVGSIFTLFAVDFDFMLVGRFLQGLGSGGCFTLGTAIIFDVFKEKQATDALNKINVLVPFLMASAPLLGGILNAHYGFRSNFLAITISVFICLILCSLFLNETLSKDARSSFKVTSILRDFRRVLLDSRFLKLTFVVSLVFCGFLVFLSSTAILFVVEMGVEKTMFPLFQCALLVAYLLASLITTQIINKYGVVFVKKLGLFAIFLASLNLLIFSTLTPTNPAILTIAMVPFGSGFIWIQTPYVTELMELMPEIKGITASVLTSLRLLITAVVVSLSSSFYNTTIWPTSISITLITFSVGAIIYSYEKQKKLRNLNSPIFNRG